MSRVWRILAILTLILSPLTLEADSEKILSYFMCKNAEIVRTIRVIETSSKGCQTLYTKAGEDRVVGWGQSLYSCNKIRDNIKGNLEEYDWQCKDVSQGAQVSYFEDTRVPADSE